MKHLLLSTALIVLNSLVSITFSQQQSNKHLLKDAQMETLLDSTVTASFYNNVYMDVWERLWIPNHQKLACIDLSADTLDVQFVNLDTDVNIHDVCWLNNGNMIVATDSTLFFLTDEGYTEIAKLPYPGMCVRAASDSTLYIFGKSTVRNEYDVSLFTISGSLQRLFSTKERIVDVVGNGNITILVLDKELALFSPKVEPTVFFSFDSEIQSIAITDYGSFFIATSNGILYFDDLGHFYLLSKIGAKKLWYRNRKLYILFKNGNFSVMPINNIQE